MANYLERVASSASRRAGTARPPNSGPPVLPAGRDFSLAVQDPFAANQDQFLEPLETHAPTQTEESAESPSSKLEVESKTQDSTPVEPAPKPRTSHDRLSSESPFTVSLPRTLRPISSANVLPTVSVEPSCEQPRVRPSTTGGPEEFQTGEEPARIIRSTDFDVKEVSESATPEADTAPLRARSRPTQPVAEHQPQPVHTETARSDTTPIPRVDGPARLAVAEPTPLPALPVHVPPVASSSATRQEQSRISIGSLEVLVNNHPKVTNARPAPTPSRSESLNLEKRYLDRFRLRH